MSFVIWLGGCGDLTGDIQSLTITPDNPTIGVNQQQAFSVIAHDSLGNIVTPDTVSWAVNGSIGSVSSASGAYMSFTAGNSAESGGTIVATYLTISTSVTVTITENGQLIGVVNDPNFSASGKAQGIVVSLFNHAGLTGTSDTNGNYMILNIPPGTYTATTDATTVYQGATLTPVTVGRGETVTWNPILDTQPGTPTIPTTTIPTFI